jgi:hypothetical protein
MANERRITLTNVKCPSCKVTLLVKPSLKVCPVCRGLLPRRQKVDRSPPPVASWRHPTPKVGCIIPTCWIWF